LSDTGALSLLGTFSLRLGDNAVAVSHAGERLLALLAVARRPVRRQAAAASLWPEQDDAHAGQNLRSVLHRLVACTDVPLVEAGRETLVLPAHVQVDLHARAELALALCESGAPPGEVMTDDARALAEAFEEDLLPDWHDEWLHFERERYRQLRMHALEALAARLCDAGRYAVALHAALGAVAVEPLRESGHRAVIEVHLREGNVGEALRQFDTCRRLLDEHLGIRPSRALETLVFSAC
jgi:DNA-binding SARP family transcriptional activator